MPKSRGGIYLFKSDIFQIWRHGGLRASDKNKKTSISCPTLDDLPPRCPQGGLSSHVKWELESSSFPWFWDASGRVNDKGLWKWWGRGRRTYPAFTKCRAGPSVCRGSYHLHGDSVRQVRGLRSRGDWDPEGPVVRPGSSRKWGSGQGLKPTCSVPELLIVTLNWLFKILEIVLIFIFLLMDSFS